MATFKALVLPHNKKADGTYNVKIRITHQRKSKYIATPFFVTQSQLTRSLKLKDPLIVEQVEAEIRRLREKVYEIGFIVDTLDVDQLITRLNYSEEDVSFTDYMQRKIDLLNNDISRKNTAHRYQTTLHALLAYTDNKTVLFSQMTKNFMRDYYNYLLKNKSVVTANSYITTLKTFYSMAQKELNDEETGIVVVKYRCFDAIELEKPQDTKIRAFEKIEDMQAVIDCPYSGNWLQDFMKDMFVLSFVLMGMNSADLFALKKTDYSEGIITYRRKKIERRAGKRCEMKIKVPEVASIILRKYNADPIYLIDFNGYSRNVSQCRNIQHTFKRAGLSNNEDNTENYYVFYSARHSMATFARNICRIDKLTVHEMLNHMTSKEFAITDVYLRRDYIHLWEANDKLLALFDWSFYLQQKKALE
ncbi:MAG: site-specific integrase [Paludibacter sp.]|nr:site-specific integrase [Bacteroides sp.]MCM1403039.1 site-specific integrase [Bacteroides sp.]MCM1442824.1 site-specific integrase [Muribaculum sp.]MCM1481810.1 site-specific integrase [Paludibacter sp.]MCM1576187.1 site-specific integrase [Bacteroides sp.]